MQLVEFCQAHDVAVQAYSPLGCGQLLMETGVQELAQSLAKEVGPKS